MNFAANLAGVAAPIATGYIVGMTNSFSGAFLAAAIILLIVIAFYVGVMGRIEPIPNLLASSKGTDSASLP